MRRIPAVRRLLFVLFERLPKGGVAFFFKKNLEKVWWLYIFMYLYNIKQTNRVMKAQVTIKGSVFAAAKIRNNFWSTSFDKAKYAQGCESFYTAEFPTIKAAKAAIREAFNSMKSEDLVSSHDRYNGGEGFTYDSAICEIVRN